MEYSEKYNLLVDNFAKSTNVTKFNSMSERENETLAHALLDLDESFNKVSKELLPKLLTRNISTNSVDDILFEIGEELRHILYHINDTNYFSYLPKS